MKPRLLLVGTPFLGPGYPHPTRMLALLREAVPDSVQDLTVPLRVRAVGGHAPWRACARLVVLLLASLLALGRWLHARGDQDRVYLPYPAVPVLWLMSLLPRRLRPARLVADCFVSWYDAAVVDRRLLAPDSLPARLLRAVERRALRVADVVLCDTRENAAAWALQLDLPETSLRAAPLATLGFTPSGGARKPPGEAALVVLYVGTFVPLHGTQVVAEAIGLLADEPGLRFEILGTGQDAEAFARAVRDIQPERLRWRRALIDHAEVCERVAAADICLGVFGAGPKTARVWPLKNYLYAEAAKPLVSAAVFGFPHEARPRDGEHLLAVPPGDARALAQAIRRLAADAALRERLGLGARRLFEGGLRPECARDAVLEALDLEGK